MSTRHKPKPVQRSQFGELRAGVPVAGTQQSTADYRHQRERNSHAGESGGLWTKNPSCPPLQACLFPVLSARTSIRNCKVNSAQSIFNLVQRRNYNSIRRVNDSSVLTAKDTRELVVLAVAGTYLQAMAARRGSYRNRLKYKMLDAIYKQAQVRKTAGVNSRIDVMRSLVELQTQQQRLNSLNPMSQTEIRAGEADRRALEPRPGSSGAFTADGATIPEETTAIQSAMAKRSICVPARRRYGWPNWPSSAARAERFQASV